MAFVEQGIEDGLPFVISDTFPDVQFYKVDDSTVEVVSSEGVIVRTFSLSDVVTSLEDTAAALRNNITDSEIVDQSTEE